MMRPFVFKSLSGCSRRQSRNMGTLSFQKFGPVSEVLSNLKTGELDGPTLAQVKVSIKASQILPEDIRSIQGLSFANSHVGVAGSTAVGTVAAVPQGELDFAVNDTVLVVGNGTWTSQGIFSRSALSKLSNLPAEDAATLPSYLSAWVLLHNYASLKSGDIVVQSSGETAVGAALTQIGTALGFKVISPTAAELQDPKFVSNMKSQQDSIKLVVSDRSGRIATDLTRILADNGTLVVYNGVKESIASVEGVDQPAAGSIYRNLSVCGFDFTTWYRTARADGSFQKALSSVLALGNEKKLNLKPKVYPQADFQKAIAEVDKSATAAVIKF